LKLIYFTWRTLTNMLTCSATASKVTTLWRYRNVCIIIFVQEA